MNRERERELSRESNIITDLEMRFADVQRTQHKCDRRMLEAEGVVREERNGRRNNRMRARYSTKIHLS